MQGSKQVIQQLNQVLFHELTAINQYFLHSRMFNYWGIEGLGDAEGLLNLQRHGKLYIGQHTEEVLKCDVRKVKENIEALQSAVKMAEQEMDYVTRDLLRSILEKDEDYLDWADTQLDLIGKVGIENFIQKNMEEE